jgi:branched-chain amino acid transport system permease protein
MVELLVSGLARGSVYALVALGYTMVYGILGMINFAHGEVFMLAMFACVFGLGALTGWLGAGGAGYLILSAVGAVVVAGLFGYLNERIAYRRLRQANLLAPLTTAIGLSIVLQNFIMLAVSKDKVDFPGHYSQFLMEGGWTVGGTTITYLQLAVLGTALVMMIGVFALIHGTRLGIALRATAQDRVMAGLVGIPVDRVIALTFVLGSALAAVAAVLVAMYQGVIRFDAGYVMGMKAFTAAVLGGIGNIPGAVLGGLILGLAEDLTTRWLGSDWKNLSSFVILMAVLILRPRGLLGERVADKV